MALSLRQKITVISLVLYWPSLFALTHIPNPQRIFKHIPSSDKMLHFFAYLVLVFLLWLAISPARKVNWRKASVWWVLLVIVWYGALDEWLQGYMGRCPQFSDFFADLAGAITGLILLTIFPFWPIYIGLTAAVIFILTNFLQANFVDDMPFLIVVFHLGAYGFFSMLWARYACHLLGVKAPQPKWLIAVLVVPIGFLLMVESFSAIAYEGFRWKDMFISIASIVAVVFGIYMVALLRLRFGQKGSGANLERSI